MSKSGVHCDRPGGDTLPSKKTMEKLCADSVLCSEPVTKDGCRKCLQHSACLGMSVDQCCVLDSMSGNIIYFCSTCVMHLPAAMQSYESDIEQLKVMDKNIDSRLDALEAREVTKQTVNCSISELSNQIEEHIFNLGSKIQSLTSNHSTVLMEVDSATASLQSPLPGSVLLVSMASSIANELADREWHKNNIIFTILLKILTGKLIKKFSQICVKLYFVKSLQPIKLFILVNVMIDRGLYWLFFRMNLIKCFFLQILQSFVNTTLTSVCTCPLTTKFE